MSEPINEIAGALAKAQLEIENPPLDSVNPHFKSKFAGLPGVRNAIVPILAKHGIAVCQNLTNTERGIACTTVLTHTSGQQMTFGPLEIPATKPDAQGLGSAATYARRYALLAIACVAGELDDDAEAAVRPNGNGKARETITEKQAADLDALISEIGVDRSRAMRAWKVSDLRQIHPSAYSECVRQVESKRKASVQ